jgi:hypothetical protein
MGPVSGGVRVDTNELLLEDVFHDSDFIAVAGEGRSRVVENGKEVERQESTEIVLEREGGGAWDPEDVFGSFGFRWCELGENWDEIFRDWESHEKFEKFVAPGGFFPETGVGGWGGTKVTIRGEEVTVENSGIIHGDGGGGHFGMDAGVIGEGEAADNEHDVRDDDHEVGEHVYDPFISSFGFDSGVAFESSQDVT